jgi:hypothetical protein
MSLGHGDGGGVSSEKRRQGLGTATGSSRRSNGAEVSGVGHCGDGRGASGKGNTRKIDWGKREGKGNMEISVFSLTNLGYMDCATYQP